MRQLTFFLIICVTISCATTKASKMTSGILNGTWVPVKQETGGTLLPKDAFEYPKLIIRDSTYTFTAESIDKGVVKYRHHKMDIYSKEGVNAGKHFTATYRFENKQLAICYNLAGDSYPETFETIGKPRYFLSVFKKELMK